MTNKPIQIGALVMLMAVPFLPTGAACGAGDLGCVTAEATAVFDSGCDYVPIETNEQSTDYGDEDCWYLEAHAYGDNYVVGTTGTISVFSNTGTDSASCEYNGDCETGYPWIKVTNPTSASCVWAYAQIVVEQVIVDTDASDDCS